MLEFIVNGHVIYVLMGICAAGGIVAKIVTGVTLGRLVEAAEGMGKSNHPLMRLVRAKFEHTCMISEKVENVGVFVDKYIYEYRAGGVRLHTWRRLQMMGAGACMLLGGAGAWMSYRIKGGSDQMAVIGGTGAALALIVFLIHMLTDEEYRMEAVRNYMVDYLENIYQHRYEKAYKKEVRTQEEPGNPEKMSESQEKVMERQGASVERQGASAERQEAVSERQKKAPEMREPADLGPDSQKQTENDSLIWAMYKTEPLQVEDERKVTAPAQAGTTEKSVENVKKEEEKSQRIREILEEFMA